VNVNRPADRPPILRFLVVFAGLIAVALALALARASGAADPPDRAATAEPGSGRPSLESAPSPRAAEVSEAVNSAAKASRL
jgi:hypothetical protein